MKAEVTEIIDNGKKGKFRHAIRFSVVFEKEELESLPDKDLMPTIESKINEGTTVDPKNLCYFAERIINDLNELKNNES